MLGTMKNIVKVRDLRGKILFTLLIIGLYRLGCFIPVPGVDFAAVQALGQASESANGGALSVLKIFSGGALTQLAIFALGIMPYITASIIMQLLGVVIPKLEQWKNEGVTGQNKTTQTTRYLTLVLAIVEATSITVLLNNNAAQLGLPTNLSLIINFDIPHVLLIVLTMTAGTMLVMWMGELITQRGIGQGMSILIFANVVSALPAGFNAIRVSRSTLEFAFIIALCILLLVCIVFVEQGQRRIPVQFAKRVVGRRSYGTQNSYIPLKVNPSGVIPIIFASSVLQFPAQLGALFPSEVSTWLTDNLSRSDSLWHISVYAVLIISFAFFFTRIVFDPTKQADNVRKQGGYIPGIRPGRATESHLSQILNRLVLPGSVFLAAIALLPSFFLAKWGVNNFPFAGTTILISVGVALETMKQVNSQLTMRNYEGFLK